MQDDSRKLITLARRGGQSYREERGVLAGCQAAKKLAPTGHSHGQTPSLVRKTGALGTHASCRSRQQVSTVGKAVISGGSVSNANVGSVATPRASVSRPASSASSSTFRIMRHREVMEDPLKEFKELLEAIVESRRDLDFCEPPFCRTAVWEATWRGHQDIVRLLADKKASISWADYQGRTPLHEAAYYGNCGLVEFLLERGHPIDCTDVFGQTPLFRAVEGGRSLIVERLVEKRASVSLSDEDGLTAQHHAAFRGRQQMSEWLIYKGAWKNRLSLKEMPARLPVRTAVVQDAVSSQQLLALSNPASVDYPRKPPKPSVTSWQGRSQTNIAEDSFFLVAGLG